jgi:hypothetical protein
MVAAMAMASLVGCGGGGGGGNAAVIVPILNITLEVSQADAGKTVAAVTSTKYFKLMSGATADYEATIDGFKVGTHKIQYPVTDARPSSYGDANTNTPGNGKVDLIWHTNVTAANPQGHVVLLHLVNLSDADKQFLGQTGNDQSSVYSPY